MINKVTILNDFINNKIELQQGFNDILNFFFKNVDNLYFFQVLVHTDYIQNVYSGLEIPQIL